MDFQHQLINAFRSALGCSNVALPYWNERSTEGKDFPNGYRKPKGYDTVRYPYSGLLPPEQATEFLNGNVTRWLNPKAINNSRGYEIRVELVANYKECLDAPNYNLHDAMKRADVYPFANGAMGENDTASFDPVFFFHQLLHRLSTYSGSGRILVTSQLDIIPDLNGTKGWCFDSPSRSTSLGYDYPRPRSDFQVSGPEIREGTQNHSDWYQSRLNPRFGRDLHRGAKGKNGQPDMLLDTKSVLSRWNVASCENCQNYLDIESHRNLYGFSDDEALDTEFYALVHTRDNPEGIDTIEGKKVQAEIGTAQ
ncbi:hypothetical protein BDP81DRAFT_485251 [Colletotrichum phormii]|uniref:Tyrosinase copper-binding domain-containing protein n=1 Tax=Colletotrichum phormii TaxID=359342 RepID=A0AAI9ZED1_9PEZI|nr:uncharacterized protein BDP81DRAFT_485251 [Colletotrichum phormii]KAK1622988.1 hypothetical protein BDP81DRAFT_485251 [Colletotrichum phormii]